MKHKLNKLPKNECEKIEEETERKKIKELLDTKKNVEMEIKGEKVEYKNRKTENFRETETNEIKDRCH